MKTWPLALLLAFPTLAPAGPPPQVIPDVVYGHKDGMALTYEVIRPAKQSGAAILWIQSGGWYSTYTEPKNLIGASKGFLDKDYTVVIIRHASAQDTLSRRRRPMSAVPFGRSASTPRHTASIRTGSESWARAPEATCH